MKGGVYSRIKKLLYMPQWLRNALLPHSRTDSNTPDSRLQSGAKKDGTLRSGRRWESLTVSPMWKMFTWMYFEVLIYCSDDERKRHWKEMYKKEHMQGNKCALLLHIYFKPPGDLKFTGVTATLPLSKDKAVFDDATLSTSTIRVV